MQLPGIVMLEPGTLRQCWVLLRDADAFVQRGYLPADREAESTVSPQPESAGPVSPSPGPVGLGRQSAGVRLPRRMSGGQKS